MSVYIFIFNLNKIESFNDIINSADYDSSYIKNKNMMIQILQCYYRYEVDLTSYG